MTHILFVTGEYPPMEGGVGAYTFELAKALTQLGIEVSIATSLHAASNDLRFAIPALKVYPIANRWGPALCIAIGKLAHEIRADWIHLQYQTAAYAMNPAVNFAPRLWKKSAHVAWTYHDLLPPYLFPKAGSRLRRWVTEQPATTSDLAIVTNEGDRKQLAQKGIEVTKIPIGSNIRGQLHSPEDRAQRRRQRSFAEKDLVIGYFGFLNRSKGGATVVQTLKELLQNRSNVHLLMVGDVAGASDPTNRLYFDEISQMIEALGLADHVHWTGREDDAEVSADLGACDLLLLPYLDGASLRRGTLMAALANGCPIVTTMPQVPLPELVDGRDLVYIPVEDVHSAAQVALRIANTPQLADALRSNAWERSQLFGWASIAQQHVDCYQRFK